MDLLYYVSTPKIQRHFVDPPTRVIGCALREQKGHQSLAWWGAYALARPPPRRRLTAISLSRSHPLVVP